MAATRPRFGGIRNINPGELGTYDQAEQMQQMPLQTLFHLLAELCWDEGNNQPRTGFPGDDCLVHTPAVDGSGNPQVTMDAGVGMYWDSSATDEFSSHYLPVVVDAAVNIVLDPHDATNPRIDIICLAPEDVADQSGSRTIKDVSTGNISLQTVFQRERLTYKKQTVSGTPAATPTVPATPSGYVKIAEVSVPATSGVPTGIVDTRPVLQIRPGWKQDVPTDYHQNWVPGSGNELFVEPNSPANEYVLARAGDAVIQGVRVRIQEQQVGPFANRDATNDRYDLVVVNKNGTLSIKTGTPAASPVPPTVDADELQILRVTIPGGATTPPVISSSMDRTRPRYPMGPDQIDDFAVENRHIKSGEVSTSKLEDDAVTTDKLDPTVLKHIDVTIPAASVRTLFSTPYEILPASAVGASKYAEFVSATLRLEWDGGTAHPVPPPADNLFFLYNAGPDVSAEIEGANFIHATSIALRHANGMASDSPMANTAIQLSMKNADLGGTGTSPVKVRLYYRLLDTFWF